MTSVVPPLMLTFDVDTHHLITKPADDLVVDSLRLVLLYVLGIPLEL